MLISRSMRKEIILKFRSYKKLRPEIREMTLRLNLYEDLPTRAEA